MESTATARVAMDPTAKVRTPSGAQLLKLREYASLQQDQIDTKNRLLLDKEQRRTYLASLQLNSPTNGQIVEYDQSMNQFRERLNSQESRLHRLRAIKSQLKAQRSANTNLCSELETMRVVFKEKERELAVANTKIDALTRQLDDMSIRTKAPGNNNNNNNKHTTPSGSLAKGTKHLSELERLRQELLYKSKVSQQNDQQLLHKRNLLYKSQSEQILLNSRVKTLQDRLARKIEFNRQTKVPSSIAAALVASAGNNQDVIHDTGVSVSNSLSDAQAALSASLGRAAAAASNYQKSRISATIPTSKPSATVHPAQAIPQPQPVAQNIAAVEPFQRVVEPLKQSNNSFIVTKQFSSDDSSSSSKDKDSGISLDIHGGKATPDDDDDDDDTAVPKDMLEDRPSPSGSSGSSDRISTSYPFSAQKHRAYSTNNSSGSTTDSGIDQIDRSASYNNYSRHHLPPTDSYLESQALAGEEYISRIPDGSGSGSRKEGSVSDLIKTFNTKCRTTGSVAAGDWQRTKRRPVTDEADLEKELAEHSQTQGFRTGSAASVDTISIEAAGVTSEVPIRMGHEDEQVSESCELESFESSIDSSLSSLADVDETIAQEAVEPADMSIINNSDLIPTRDEGAGGDKGIRPILRTGKRQSLRVRFDPLVLLLDAALEGELELVRNLAKQVPNVSASNDEGITALHNATCAGHFEIVKYLVEYGFDVNAQDTDGWMPLHCAASCNNLPMIKFLVNSGAAIFGTTFTDDETAAQKCEEDEEGFDGCSQYLYAVQEQLGVENSGIVYTLYDYKAERDDELSFSVGDALQIVGKSEPNWWWARAADQSEGLVSKTFIGLCPKLKALH